MPRRISAEVDMNILADIAMGKPNKDIAVDYGVSPSYVSKLKRGKKVIDMHIPKPEVYKSIDFSAYKSELEAVEKVIAETTMFNESDKVLSYIKEQIYKHISRAKVYIEILKKYKGE